MTLEDIKTRKKNIFALIEHNRIYEAIDNLMALVNETGSFELKKLTEETQTAYNYMLDFFSKGIDDPKRNDVMNNIISSIYSITDRCEIEIAEPLSHDLFYSRRAKFNNINLYQLIENYKTNLDNLSTPEGDDFPSLKKKSEEIENDIFSKIWSAFPLSLDDANALNGFFSSRIFPDHAKALAVMALFLGLTRYYDEQKVNLLIDSYINSDSPMVEVRAVTSLVIIALLYPKRLILSKKTYGFLEIMSEMPDFQSDVESVLMRLIKSRNTDNITQKLQNDFMPSILNVDPELIKKIKSQNINLLDINELEANPEWQDMLEKSGIADKIQELNEIQFDGGDVMISSFAKLKSFPFFNYLCNWFMPFNPAHSMVLDALDNKGDLAGLLNDLSFLMCDSDKYSLCFSLAQMPESHRESLFSQLSQHTNEIKDMSHDQFMYNEPEAQRDMAINRIIQDLYRFWKLFSRRNEFANIFNLKFDLTSLPYKQFFMPYESILIPTAAEFYFKNKFYNDAIDYYKYMVNNKLTDEDQIYQKIGFAYQNLGKYDKALHYYKLYELIDDCNLWNMQHMASCYRLTKQVDKALECYEKADKANPNNLSLTLNIGHCLLELGNTDQALKYYYKADFLDNSKHRAWRPIAWCEFLNNNFEHSQQYYNKIVDKEMATATDWLNMGHLQLCQNNLNDALKLYAKAINAYKNNETDFVTDFNKDLPTLKDKNVNIDDSQFIIDAAIKCAKS